LPNAHERSRAALIGSCAQFVASVIERDHERRIAPGVGVQRRRQSAIDARRPIFDRHVTDLARYLIPPGDRESR
jgi:hypothetical protein